MQANKSQVYLNYCSERSRTSTKLKEKRRNGDPSSLRSVGMTSTRLSFLFHLSSLICYLYSIIFALLSVLCSLLSVLCYLLSKKSALPHGTLGCCTIAHYILYFISTFRGKYLQNIIIQCITARKSKLFPYPARTVAVYDVTVLHFVFPVICWLRPSCSRSA